MSLNFSRYCIYLATGENTLFNNLTILRDTLPEGSKWTQEFLPLQCGDVMISSLTEEEDYKESIKELTGKELPVKPLVLIERKRINDFCESYKSGRLQSQRARMSTFRDQTGCACHLVVEGYEKEMKRTRSKKISGFTKPALEQCWVSTRIRDRLFTYHVTDEEGHAEYIWSCLKTLEKYSVYKGTGHVAQKSFDASLKLKNKSNMTPSKYFQKMIAGLPMFSMDIAEKIVEQYPTFAKLVDELEANGIKNVQEIKVGKNRLGKVKAQRLVEYLMN